MTIDNEAVVSYHRKRAKQERLRAETAADDFARRAHRELADRHDRAADSGGYQLPSDIDR